MPVPTPYPSVSPLHPLTPSTPAVLFSIVSHGQLHLVSPLLVDLRRVLQPGQSIVLVLNVPEDEGCLQGFRDMPITVIRNTRRLGFGANHNQAFASTPSDFFFIVNPDIRMRHFSTAALLAPFDAKDVAAVAPVVLSPSGQVEDSVRFFPTMRRLFSRTVLRRRQADYQWDKTPIAVDWSAGMFVAFRSAAFSQVSGFDERYFMYMEDADICRRLSKAGWRTLLQPATTVVHYAQRASRHSIRHLRWHFSSALRFLFLPPR